MTKKDFFRVLIKLFGLYWLISTVFSLSQIVYISANNAGWMGIIYSVVMLSILGFLFYVLIFKSDSIIDLLKLDKGFDEDRIEFQNFNTENILMLAVIIIGATMILDSIAIFLNQIYLGVKVFMSNQSDYVTINGQSNYQLMFSSTKLVLGYILLTNYPSISKFLLKITQKKV